MTIASLGWHSTGSLPDNLKGEAGNDVRRGIGRAYQLALSRPPVADELRDAETVVRAHGLATLCRALFNSNEFLFVP